MVSNGAAWVTIYRSPSAKSFRDNALVLQAAGIPYETGQGADGFALHVAPVDEERARAELDAYDVEGRVQTSDSPPARGDADGWTGVLGFGTVLLLTAVLEQWRAFGFNWFEAGKTSALKIRQGEWWRTVTALTLHADAAHLLSNLVIGGLVGLFAGQALGSGLAWFIILIGGTLGNLLNAWVRSPDHTSVGSSTAVFAALGLLAANAWRQRRMLSITRLDRWAPVVAGVLLLSFLGTGGGRTDIGAHVFGFFFGAILGAGCGRLSEDAVPPRKAQGLFGLAALAILIVGWAFALLPRRG